MDWSIIFGGAVLGSCVGVCGAAMNAFFQRRFESRKWHADFFVKPQVDALCALHSAIVGCQMEIFAIPHKPEAMRMWENDNEKQSVYESKKAVLDRLTGAMLAAGIYLDPSDMTMLFNFRENFYRHQILGHFSPGGSGINPASQTPIGDAYGAIEGRLRELLDPRAILSQLGE